MFTTPIMGFRSPEAKYNTYYAPDYYPYYPWDAYYGGAYYYGELSRGISAALFCRAECTPSSSASSAPK